MRDKSEKVSNETSGEILEKWIKRMIFTYLISWAIISLLGYLFIKLNLYMEYYFNFIIELLFVPGIIIFLLGLIINELTYFLRIKVIKE